MPILASPNTKHIIFYFIFCKKHLAPRIFRQQNILLNIQTRKFEIVHMIWIFKPCLSTFNIFDSYILPKVSKFERLGLNIQIGSFRMSNFWFYFVFFIPNIFFIWHVIWKKTKQLCEDLTNAFTTIKKFSCVSQPKSMHCGP